MADLDKTIKAMEFCNRTDGCNSKCPYFNEEKLDVPCFIKARFDALELLKEQPKIVRCKACQKHGKPECPVQILFPNDCISRTDDDWFCADGEPKDGEPNDT